jgi:hypothetical protein
MRHKNCATNVKKIAAYAPIKINAVNVLQVNFYFKMVHVLLKMIAKI